MNPRWGVRFTDNARQPGNLNYEKVIVGYGVPPNTSGDQEIIDIIKGYVCKDEVLKEYSFNLFDGMKQDYFEWEIRKRCPSLYRL